MKRLLCSCLTTVCLLAPVAPGEEIAPYEIRVDSGRSLVHIGSLDSFDVTSGGMLAATLMYEALDKDEPSQATWAAEIYDRLIPEENFGGEYSALQWFCEYFVASEEERKTFLQDPLVEAYFHFFADNDWAVLKEYLRRKYKMRKTPRPGDRTGDPSPGASDVPGRPGEKGDATRPARPGGEGADPNVEDFAPEEREDPEVGHTRRAFLEDFILFNNPKREQWERTSKIVSLLGLKEGDKVADIGCGPGYYDYKFSKLVGRKGRVYAIDIKQEHLDFVDQFVRDQGIGNIQTVLSKTNDICVDDRVDVAFMCSLYHIIYTLASETERGQFIESIRRALKEDGALVVVDNGPVEDTELPYHGPYIAKELIISQLQQYGFRFEEHCQVIPQRYVLIFRP
jgi:ubiquinone/menaquinone biosynthesis C-methylase UbiE